MRLAAILCCSFAAVMLLLGSVTSTWFEVPDAPATSPVTARERPESFSLRNARVCQPSDDFFDFDFDFDGKSCRTVSYSDIGAADGEAVALMRLTLILGLLSMLWLIATAILVGIEVRAERGFAIAAAAVSCACVLSAVGVNVIRPRLLTELDATVGSSFWLYMLGALSGLAGGICGARVRRATAAADLPGDPRTLFPPELTDPPAPGAPRTAIPSPIPLPSPPVQPRPCPRCNNPARWVPGYRRHWCDACTNWI